MSKYKLQIRFNYGSGYTISPNYECHCKEMIEQYVGELIEINPDHYYYECEWVRI